MGDPFSIKHGPHELRKITGGSHILINFILKFYIISKEKKLCQGARETSLDFLLVMEFRFDTMLCFNLDNENSDQQG